MDASSFTAEPSDMGNIQVDDDPTPSTSTSESTVVNTVCSKQDTETKPCFVCNEHVPFTFLYEHKNSTKHKNWLSLTRIMLERNRLHRKQQETLGDTSSSTYYCEPCDCIVETLNRSIHEGSKSHLGKTQYSKLLDIFMSKIDTKKLEEIEIMAEIISELEKDDENDSEDIAKKVSDEEIVKTEIVKTKIVKIESPADFVRMIIDKYDLNIQILEKDVEIFIQNKSVKMTENDFHGFFTNDKNQLNCNVCTAQVFNVEKHKSSLKHVQRLGVSLLATLDLFVFEGDRIKCSLCTTFIEIPTLTAHMSKDHYISMLSTFLSRETEVNYRNRECTEDVKYVFDEPTMKFKIQNNILKYFEFDDRDNSMLRCLVCTENVDRSALIAHAGSHLHNYNLLALRKKNHIIDLSLFQSRCELCKCNIKRFNELRHIHKKNHIVEMNKLNSLQQDTTHLQDTINLHQCYICNEQISNNATVIREHNQSNTHIDNQREYISKNPIEPFEVNYQFITSECTMFLYCLVCHRYIKYSRETMEDHINNRQHSYSYTNWMVSNGIFSVKPNLKYCFACKVWIGRFKEIEHIQSDMHLNVDNDDLERDGDVTSDESVARSSRE